jgi:hypothetical protein
MNIAGVTYGILTRSAPAPGRTPRKWIVGDGLGNFGEDGCSYMAFEWTDPCNAIDVMAELASRFPKRSLHLVEFTGFSTFKEFL